MPVGATSITPSGLRRYRRWVNQYKATRGTAPSKDMQESFLQAEIEATLGRAYKMGEIQEQRRQRGLEMASEYALRGKVLKEEKKLGEEQLGLLQSQMDAEERAARITGLSEIGSFAFQAAPEIGRGVGKLKEKFSPFEQTPSTLGPVDPGVELMERAKIAGEPIALKGKGGETLFFGESGASMIKPISEIPESAYDPDLSKAEILQSQTERVPVAEAVEKVDTGTYLGSGDIEGVSKRSGKWFSASGIGVNIISDITRSQVGKWTQDSPEFTKALTMGSTEGALTFLGTGLTSLIETGAIGFDPWSIAFAGLSSALGQTEEGQQYMTAKRIEPAVREVGERFLPTVSKAFSGGLGLGTAF